jgi:hypothetical protein
VGAIGATVPRYEMLIGLPTDRTQGSSGVVVVGAITVTS